MIHDWKKTKRANKLNKTLLFVMNGRRLAKLNQQIILSSLDDIAKEIEEYIAKIKNKS